MKIESREDFGVLLESLGRPITDCEVAEIGVAEGLYSRIILRWGVKRLYLVDTWETIPGQRGDAAEPQAWHDENLRQCELRVMDHYARTIFLRGRSVEMADRVPDGSLDLVHLDGDHSYAGVMNDLREWWPKLRPGGIMSGHDYLAPEYQVQAAVCDFLHNIGEPVNVHEAASGEDASFYFFKGGE